MVDVLILMFIVNTLFAAWVVFRGGAEWLWRSLADVLPRGSWTPRTLRKAIAALWGLNAFALWTILR